MNGIAETPTDVGRENYALADALRPVLGRLTLMLRREASHLPVTASQATVLALLLEGPKRMSDLTQLVGVTGPSMTVLVDRMERQGWVRRCPDPDDRRSVRAEITSAGREAMTEVQAVRTASLAQRLATLSGQDRAAIAEALPALAALIDTRG